ncbi:SGNH hydrolase [Kitasatospora nipponensis]|uniref:SGNH hydrolase n=1 Tax=Kitasatospora nipponensis TaxID=258049 RepID=A0ABN1WBR3_9ACTN
MTAAALTAGLLTAASVPAAAAAQPTIPANLPQAPKIDPAVAQAQQAAGQAAKKSGKPVVVDALTTENTQTVANADGTFTLTQNAAPVRAKKNGSWVKVDTTLAKRADGTLAPAATASDVSFSAGGNGPMVTLSRAGRKLSLSWPTALPVPAVSGDTATYANVLPDVDLALSAHEDGGFSQVLVVKNAAAAANPALGNLRFGLQADGLTVNQTAGGAQARDDQGQVVFRADPAQLWDSATTAPKPAVAVAPHAHMLAASDQVSVPKADPTPSGIKGPGDVARHALMPVNVDQHSLTVTPDKALLTDPGNQYPLYVDPSWSGSPSVVSWASINDKGARDTSGTVARLGYEGNWNGCGSYCYSTYRSYFEMNDSGFQGANVTSAHFYPYYNWAACSCAEPTQIWLDPDFDANWITWSNKPSGSSSSLITTSSDCTGNGGGCGYGYIPNAYDVTSAAKEAAGGGRRTFEVDAQSESDQNQWKKIDPTQTYWSVTYYVAPYVNYVTSGPMVTAFGGNYMNSNNITMTATGGDSDGEAVRSGYEIWNTSGYGGNATTAVAGGLFTGYSASGGSYTYSGLPDGTYAWRGVTNSQSGNMWSGWGPWTWFQVETAKPNAPAISSPQFPANQFGASLNDQGSFTMTTYGNTDVVGYVFALDGDLGSANWSQQSQPSTFTNGSTINRGQQYWAPANGTVATVQFSPLTVGPHRLYARALNHSGLLSAAQTTYLFYAGLTTPTYVYGDQLVNGYTATNDDHSTTALAAAQATVSAGAVIQVQNNCCNIQFADGAQALFTDSATGHTALNDKVAFNFDVPHDGYWDIGANFTQSAGFGQLKLVLDAGSANAATLTNSFDGYSSYVTTSYQDFGLPKNSSGAPVLLTKGSHTLTMTMVGKNAGTVGYGYKAGIDVLRLAPMSATCAINNLTACQNNTAVSQNYYTNAGDADGNGNSYSASELSAAGWTPGAPLTVNGAPMTVPNYSNGKADNIVAGGQTITVPASGFANTGNAVVFLGFATGGSVNGATGTISYASPCGIKTTQDYTIDTAPDWVLGNAYQVSTQLQHRNTPNNTQDTNAPKLFALSVPLACPGQAISSIQLPVVSNGVKSGVTTLHVLGVGIRPTSFTDTGHTTAWTGTFADRQDTSHTSLGAVTQRSAVRISVAGQNARIHLSNTLGSQPVTLDHVTLAHQSSGNVPTGTPVDLLFNGSKSVTIPAGGDVTSDSLAFATTDRETLLISYHLATAVTDAVHHYGYKGSTWYSAAGTDATAATTGTPFTSTDDNLYWLSGVDVNTTNNTTGSLLLLGDQTVNSDTTAADGGHRLSDLIANDLAAGNSNAVPYGILNEGQNTWDLSHDLLPSVTNSAAPSNASNPADRYVLNQTNVRTVLISLGTTDILDNVAAGDVEARLSRLSKEISAYYSETGLNNPYGQITVYVATIPPDLRMTPAQDLVRQVVNAYILGSGGTSYLGGNASGVVDFSAAVTAAGTGTSTVQGDLAANFKYQDTTSLNYYPNTLYYQALADKYVAAVNANGGTVGVQPMIVKSSLR